MSVLDNPVQAIEVADDKLRDKGPVGLGSGVGFEAGHTYSKGRGRPKKVTELAYLDKFRSVIDIETFGEIVEKAKDKALEGDFQYFKEVVRQALGNPKERVQVTTTQDDTLANIQAMLSNAGFSVSLPVEADHWTVIEPDISEQESEEND